MGCSLGGSRSRCSRSGSRRCGGSRRCRFGGARRGSGRSREPFLDTLMATARALFAGSGRVGSVLALSGRSSGRLRHGNLGCKKCGGNRHTTNRYPHTTPPKMRNKKQPQYGVILRLTEKPVTKRNAPCITSVSPELATLWAICGISAKKSSLYPGCQRCIMNQSAFSSAQSGHKRSIANDFFTAHPVGDIVRNLLFSSVCWVFIVFAVYTVYSMVLSRN
jgi:hypothetical protein